MTEPGKQAAAIELSNISKRFGAVLANSDVSLGISAGSIHGIVGENGAGKSTLMSILYGFYEADSGTIAVNGKITPIRSPAEAIRAGIGMVHQHFMLVDTLSVVENVMLGAEGGVLLARGKAGVRAMLARQGAELGLGIDPDAIVGDLPVGLRQRVEILKALARDAKVLILDEPTAVLTPDEAEALFVLLRRLRDQGRTVILITHKLHEILAVTDQVSVMRQGRLVGTVPTHEATSRQLAEMMVGRKVLLKVEKGPRLPGDTVLAAKRLSYRDSDGVVRLSGISLSIAAGEILGVAGVSGNGQSELLDVLAGLVQPWQGEITLGGKVLDAAARQPANLRRLGVMHVPEDRQRRGLVTAFAEMESAILGYQDDPALGHGPLLSPALIRRRAEDEMALFDIRPADCTLKTANFSGGNQQKIVLAREIERRPLVLLVGQPTRGVDIGAIEFIHRRLVALRDAGVAVLLVSSELEEIMGLADRILVMCGGRINGERLASQTDERDLGLLMAGIDGRAA